RHHTDHDKKRWPRLRCSHNIRSSRVPLLAGRRFHPQNILEDDQDEETSSAPERGRPSEKRNPPTCTRNPLPHPNPAYNPRLNNHTSTTKRALPAKPGNRTGHARRPQREPTNDKPRPLKQRSCPRQQLRRKQSLTLHNQQQLLTIARHWTHSWNPKYHLWITLTTRPHHILHRRHWYNPRGIRPSCGAVLPSSRCHLHQGLRPFLRARYNHNLRA